MRAEVEHTSSRALIRYWPIEGRSAWISVKDIDWDRGRTIKPATISVGATPGDSISPETAENYAGELVQAAAIARALDDVIRTQDDLRHVVVVENIAFADIHVCSVGEKVGVFIPDQSQYRREEAQCTG